MKYKYYFRKPKSEIVKDIIRWLFVSGCIYFAATSPYFFINLFKKFITQKPYYNRRKVYDAFYQLRKRGVVQIERRNHQIYISLTKEGKKLAGWLQIDALKIKKPNKWDRKWRIIIFDISELKRIYRDAFRGKLKELGFYQIQKSVWVHPFDCRDEIELLRSFFGLKENELRLIVAESIGNDKWLRKIFQI